MGLCRLPLVHAYDHKQGGHGKINACGVKGNQLTHKGAQHGPGYPVALIKKRGKEGGCLPFPVCKVRRTGHGT